MKALKKFLVIIACIGLLTGSATSAFGLGAILTFDELGNAYFTPSQLFPYAIATEPLSGTATLRYTLPFAGTAGDLVLEYSMGGPTSDIIRFDGLGYMYFFSDGSGGIVSLADVATLPGLISPQATLLRVLPVTAYAPAAGQPGFNSDDPSQVYNIVIPEPSALMLAATGAACLLLQLRRRIRGRE